MKNKPSNRALLLNLAVAGATAMGAQAAVAQDYYRIVHKPTGWQFHSCSTTDGTSVIADASGDTSACAQWQQVPNGSFFHIANRESGKYIRPEGSADGSPIEIQPNTWTGNWTQWSYDDRGDGFGHLVNRATGKYVYVSSTGGNGALEQQPSSWRGDYTRWSFTPVTSTPTPTPVVTTPPTSTPTPTPACTPRPPETTAFEAESGSIFGGSSLYDDGAASGGQGVAYISEVGAGFSLTNVNEADYFQLTYASELSGNISYRINSQDMGNIAFASTGAWVGNYSTITVETAIPANATVEIFFDNGDAAMNVDKIDVTKTFSCDDAPATPTPTPTETPVPSGDTVSVVTSTELGSYLVAGPGHDLAGFTLYTWDRDNGGPDSQCYDGCADTWPPYTINTAAALSGPAGVNLGTTTRTDGSLQVTLNNEPLYFYIGDTQAGDTEGHTRGGTWWVADIQGPSTPTPTPTVTTTPTPTPTPTIPPVQSEGDFCLAHDGNGNGRVTHIELPDPVSGDQYLCLNGGCYPATFNNSKRIWERPFEGLTEGTVYEIKTQLTGCNLIANVEYKAGGSCVASTCVPPDVQAPTVPTALNGTPKNGRAVDLSWTASTDDRGIARYDVYNGGALVGDTAGTSFSVTGLTESTDYNFSVRACDGSGNCSDRTAEISVNTGAFTPDIDPPSVPANVGGSATGMTSINVTWSASTDVLGVVESYRVYRNGSSVATVSGTSYEDTGLETATSYTYTVAACDDSGNCSVQSQGASIETDKPNFDNLDWTSNSFVTGKGAGPTPRMDPIDALRTPVNGLAARQYGFAFDINGGSVTWRFGSSVPNAGGVEFSCSEDDNMTFKTVSVNGSASIPCSEPYTYFFRYLHPHSLNNDPAHQWIYTGLFTTEGGRIDPYAPGAYSFTDGTANWARIRHPITTDGITAAVLDRPNAGELLRNLDRYLMWVNDDSGNVDFEMDVSFMSKSDPRVPQDVVPGFRRNEALRSAAGGPNGQQFFMINTASPFGDDYRNAPQEALEGFGDTFSYGQVISFEFSVEAAGQSPAQTYNDFSHYVVGCGFCGKYGDPRLNSAGKGGTSQVFSDAGQYIELERNAIFTQPLTTVYTEEMVDDFLVGHHLFHGIDPKQAQNINSPTRNMFDNPEVHIGEFACGSCHFRDGRGDALVETPDGLRVPPPVYGVALLEWMEGREAGFGWEGKRDTVEEQVRAALVNDHKVNPDHLPGRVLELITHYVNVLSVPDRNPGVYDQEGVSEGDVLFNQIGCADCHTPVQRTRADAPVHIRNMEIRPYTDMKVWNVNGGTYRTPPLWGLGQNLRLFGYNGKSAIYMHDGAANSIEQAIELHDGDANYSREAFRNLSGGDKQNVVNFVETL